MAEHKTWQRGVINPENLKNRAQQKGQRWSGGDRKGYLRSDVPYFNPKEGKNCIRIIQPLEAAELGHYAMDIHLHRNIGPNNEIYLCLKRMFASICYPCTLQTGELWETDPDSFKSLYPEWRILMWVLDLMLKEGEPNYLVPMIYSCPKTLMDEILTQSHRVESDTYIDVSEPVDGIPVWFNRLGQGLKTKYSGVQLGSQAWPLPESLIDLLMPFHEVLIIPTSEEVKSAFLGESIAHIVGTSGGPSPAQLPECFGKEHGVYADCDKCYAAEDCKTQTASHAVPPAPAEPSATPPPARVRKPEAAPAPAQESAPADKPAAKPTAPKPPAPAKPPAPSAPPARPAAPPSGQASDDIRARLKETIARRQAARSQT